VNWEILEGDCREVLASLPERSVQTVVTSPPYFGLRDYGTGEWEGGGDGCDHKAPALGGGAAATSLGRRPGRDRLPETNAAWAESKREHRYGDECGKCGARRVDRQIGLEPSPDEYVAGLVAVFREVRRVLRDDGTVWLNLGSSYASGGERQTGRNDTDRETPGGRGGSFRGGPRTSLGRVAGDSDPSQSRQPKRAPAYGSDGTTLRDSPEPGSAYRDLCDGCRAATLSHRDRIAGNGQPPAPDERQPSPTARDSEPRDSEPTPLDASPPDARASTIPLSVEQPRGECSHCSNCGACLAVLRSSSRDARLCARKGQHTIGIENHESESRNQDTDASGMAWVNYTRRLKPKDLIPTPWMVAMALQADGWFLRCDVIWNKANPMPESVTDRPTKAHEYLFLL
jgi:hypothetical protein